MSPCSHWHSCLSLRRSRYMTVNAPWMNWEATWYPPQLARLLVCQFTTGLRFLTFHLFSLCSLPLSFFLSPRRGISPCLLTVWQCWGSWEKGWVAPPQLEWSEDEEQHEAVEVKKTENVFTKIEVEIKPQTPVRSLRMDYRLRNTLLMQRNTKLWQDVAGPTLAIVQGPSHGLFHLGTTLLFVFLSLHHLNAAHFLNLACLRSLLLSCHTCLDTHLLSTPYS